MDNIHLEDVILVPENARNLEKDPLVFEEEDTTLMLDSTEVRRSPGMMIEDQGKAVEAQAELFGQAKKKAKEGSSPEKLKHVQTGNFVVYLLVDKSKQVTVGKVTAVSRQEQTVIVHRYKPVTDNRLRLYWLPVFVEEGQEVLGSGSQPSTETVGIERLLFPVQLHDGVLGHAAARRLDRRGRQESACPAAKA